ncbi:MAG TPA: sensor histidine kinase [Vicinamibacterales bacterium]|nr:sensor histidine kinase [Vicinamibacterales bacterium]
MRISLRTRVMLGAILWTGGLVALSFVAISHVFQHFPDLPILGKQGRIHFIWGSHALLIVLTSVIALAGGAFQVRRGLAGLKQLRSRLADVHSGRAPRVQGDYASEVQALVDDLNVLIDQREQAVRRAVAKAGDLAHGLKTPLALLALEAERASAEGNAGLAAAIREQVDRMRRQIDYHLAHARAAASGGAANVRTSVADCADGLARTLPRLYADRAVSIEVRVDPALAVRVESEDLDEMLGNLLDNACKWARSRVIIEAAQADANVRIMVDDDGPGLAAELREKVLLRGVRLDEKASGSGLGLAIVRDLAEVYRGSIALTESPFGGLRATLTLPRAE